MQGAGARVCSVGSTPICVAPALSHKRRDLSNKQSVIQSVIQKGISPIAARLAGLHLSGC